MALPAGFIASMLPGMVSSGISAITQGGPRRQYKWNKKAAEWNQVTNRANQEWLLEQNQRLQEEQRIYDSPASQMARYKAAGLNPHLIYGSGGGSAGGAFPIDAGSMPAANVQPPDASWPDIAGGYLRAGQTVAQTELTQAKTSESYANQALKSVLIDIAKTNPMLSPKVASAVADSMMEVARLKGAESQYMRTSWMDRDRDHSERIYVAKIRSEVEAMSQRLGLNTSDLQIKNKILESKDFENAIKEISVNWLKDGEMSPEHIRQGLMLILSKMLGIVSQK